MARNKSSALKNVLTFKQALSRRRLLYLLVMLAPLPLIWQFDAKLGITWLSSGLVLGAYLLYRRKVGQELLIAFLFALFITSYHPYEYDSLNVLIGKINLFPLVAWTAGLMVTREVYERLTVRHRWLTASLIYIAVLFSFEFFGYYVFNIRLDAGGPSLLGLGIIHGPPIIHLFYTLAGPIYLAVTDYLNVG